MQEQQQSEAAALDQLIADFVRASGKVSRRQARWECDEEALREEQAARVALFGALERPAAVPSVTDSDGGTGEPPPAADWVRTRSEGGELAEVAGSGRFHLERMSANNWWLVLEAEGRRVDVWLRASGRISATFESDAAPFLPARLGGLVEQLTAAPSVPASRIETGKGGEGGG